MKRLLFTLLPFLSLSLFAAPTGFDLKQGAATLIQNNIVKSGKQAIIHWDTFSIDSHEIMHFMQQDSHSKVLNRVMGKEMSHILGTLKSNGQIFLINPQGILIGPNGRIETAGFVGSTLDISDADFIKGQKLFFHNPGPGTLCNLGTITTPSGNITLISRAVKNEGTLQANNGLVSLAAGVEILLKPEGDTRISIQAGHILPNNDQEIAVENLGEIEALRIEMQACKNPYEKAVHCGGTVTAFSTQEENGRLLLIAHEGTNAISGTVSASSGTAHFLGDAVILQETACIDVSGKSQGGTILIGGDYQGNNPEIPNAKKVTLEKGSLVKADALEKGNGGRVITWGDDANHFYGSISARGGSQGGDGGFVEVSAKNWDWKFLGEVTTYAPQGNSGTLLLDPTNINIIAGAIGSSTPLFPTTPPGTYNPTTVAAATLTNGDIVNALDTTLTNVVISTASGQANPGSVAITTGPITWASNNKLTIIANQTISVEQPITNTFVGPPTTVIDFQANVGGATTGNFSGVSVTSTISTIDGHISLNGTGGNQNLNRGTIVHGSGVVQSTGNGAITLIGDAQNSGTGDDKEGVRIDGRVTVTNGLLSINANGGNGIKSQGLEVNNGGIIESVGSGNMEIIGRGGFSSGNNSTGVVLGINSNIRATGTGSLSIEGYGEGSGNGNIGVERFPDVGATSTISTVSGNIDIYAEGSPTGGTGCHGISLVVGGGGGGVIETVSGTITITAKGGGSGSSHGVNIQGAPSMIQATGSGSINIVATGSSSGSNNHGVNIVQQGMISATSGTLNVEGISGPNSSAGVVIVNNNSGIASTSGNITVTGHAIGNSTQGIFITNGGNITSTTGNITAQTFSDFFLSNANVTTAGNILISAARDASIRAQTANAAVTSTAGTTTVIADRNVILASNLPNIATISGQTGVAVVADDAFPSPPLIGSGFLDKDQDSVIVSPGGGPVRIFTARQPLNMIFGDINNAPFSAGTEFINTAQEQWGFYFYTVFGGNPFTIFYKDSIEPVIEALVNELMIANAQLSDFLPFFPRSQKPFEYQYIGEICTYETKPKALHCRPHFAPYGSFIFEDSIFWIGEKWDQSSQKTLLDYLSR